MALFQQKYDIKDLKLEYDGATTNFQRYIYFSIWCSNQT